MEAGTLDRPATNDAPVNAPAPNLAKVIDAGGGQLSFAIGGKQPTKSSLTLTGGKFEVDGQFDKGEGLVLKIERGDGSVVFEGAAIVNVVTFKDEHDSKTSQVVGCDRSHKARIAG